VLRCALSEKRVLSQGRILRLSPSGCRLGAQVCAAARAATCAAAACAGGQLVRPNEGLCFMEGLAAWLAATNGSLPLPRAQFLASLLAFASLPATQATYPLHLGAWPALTPSLAMCPGCPARAVAGPARDITWSFVLQAHWCMCGRLCLAWTSFSMVCLRGPCCRQADLASVLPCTRFCAAGHRRRVCWPRHCVTLGRSRRAHRHHA